MTILQSYACWPALKEFQNEISDIHIYIYIYIYNVCIQTKEYEKGPSYYTKIYKLNALFKDANRVVFSSKNI
ncbi:hypothetical protein ACMBCM_06415, partial [Spiroplasma sp. K1]